MVFVKCHELTCNECFGSIDAFQVHFSIKHPTCKYFRCVTKACGRSFEMWNSYRKHLRKKHNVPNHFDECNNVMQIDSTCFYDQDINFDTNIVRETELFDSISPPDFRTLLEEHTNILVSKINTKPGLSRNQVDSVIEDVSTFLGRSFLKILEQKIVNTLLTYHAKIKDISSIEDMFKSLSNPFDHLSTEYKRMMHFQHTGAYMPPKSYNIDFRLERKSTNEGIKPLMTQVTAQYIPFRNILCRNFRHVLKKFLELPDVFHITIQYMQQLQAESNTIYNFVQCQK